jgi:hypothetical protein
LLEGAADVSRDRKLDVFQLADVLVGRVYHATRGIPVEERTVTAQASGIEFEALGLRLPAT